MALQLPNQSKLFIHRHIDQNRAPAAGIAIAVDGQPSFTHIAAEKPPPEPPATYYTLWPLASISKLYTASAIMSLIAGGR